VLTSLVVSVVFLILVNAIALSRLKGTGVGAASLYSLAGIFLALYIMMLWHAVPVVLPLNALLVAIFGGTCYGLKVRPRWFVVSSLGATAAAYAIAFLPELWEWERLKKDYPLESLAGRLAYEDGARTAPPSFPDETDRLVSLETQLEQREGKQRVQSLELLHAGAVRQFIASPGFGVGRRIVLPGPFRLERDLKKRQPSEMPPIPQPAPPSPPPDLSSAAVQVASQPGFQTAHDDNTVDFLNPRRFGYVRDREHVAGFLPHQFDDSPRPPERWQVKRLELVGLLKYDEPVVTCR
jgi:hypothetical protein